MLLNNVTPASTRYMGTPEHGPRADRVNFNLAVPSCGIQETMYVRPGIFAEAEAAVYRIHGRHQREHSPSGQGLQILEDSVHQIAKFSVPIPSEVRGASPAILGPLIFLCVL